MINDESEKPLEPRVKEVAAVARVLCPNPDTTTW